MKLFKYLTADGALKTLENQRLKVSFANEVNDPFEFCVQADDTKFAIDDFCNQETRRFREMISKWYSFISFSCTDPKKTDGILLWSHYANSHTGCVLEFDSEDWLEKAYRKFKDQRDYFDKQTTNVKLPFVPFNPYPVNYDKHRVQWTDETELAEIRSVCLRKAECWDYEKEFRMMLPPNSFDVIQSQPFRYPHANFEETKTLISTLGLLLAEKDYFPARTPISGNIFSIPFPVSALKKIYCGINWNHSLDSQLLDITSKYDAKSIKIEYLDIHPKDFMMEGKILNQ